MQPQPDIGQDNTAEAKSDEVEPDPEEIIQEFMRKYGKGPKASKFFAQMSEACRKQEEVIPALTPLTIPPRPHTLIEAPTAQALPTHTKNPQILPETLTQETNPPHTSPQKETEPHAEPSVNIEETDAEEGDRMDTEESEREEGGGSLGEQEEIPDVEAAGLGDERENEEGIDGGENDGAEEVN